VEAVQALPSVQLQLRHGRGRTGLLLGRAAVPPEELNVFCDYCRFDFLTMEGNPPCPDPVTCEHGVEPRSHVENVREWMRALDIAVP
jgi:hypothetical protein